MRDAFGAAGAKRPMHPPTSRVSLTMREKDLRLGAYVAYERGPTGYLKRCFNCGETIYLWQGPDGKWRPYESWVAGNAHEGEWILHGCVQRRLPRIGL